MYITTPNDNTVQLHVQTAEETRLIREGLHAICEHNARWIHNNDTNIFTIPRAIYEQLYSGINGSRKDDIKSKSDQKQTVHKHKQIANTNNTTTRATQTKCTVNRPYGTQTSENSLICVEQHDAAVQSSLPGSPKTTSKSKGCTDSKRQTASDDVMTVASGFSDWHLYSNKY